MHISILENPVALGKAAADKAETIIKDIVAKKRPRKIGYATGRSQFEMLEALLQKDIPWEKITFFPLRRILGHVNYPQSKF